MTRAARGWKGLRVAGAAFILVVIAPTFGHGELNHQSMLDGRAIVVSGVANAQDEPPGTHLSASRERAFGAPKGVVVFGGAAVVAVVVFSAAIGLRKVRTRKLAQEERRYLATAVEQAAEAIVVTDPEGVIQYVNPAFERTTGYGLDEVIGKTSEILKSGKQDEAFYRRLWETISSGKVWSGHFVNMKKSGEIYEEDATISPVCNGSGAVVNYVAVKRDVTNQAALERRVRQAQKLEAIGILAGGIAHDFNNVLGAIIGYCEIMADKLPQQSSLRMDLGRVLEAADRARDLVRHILAFSRQGKEERCDIQVRHLLRETLKLLRPSLPATIDIQQQLDGCDGNILADPTQIQQVIMNLCTNAYQAMKPHGGILKVCLDVFDVDTQFVRLHPELRSGKCMKLSVSDTGHGITRDTMERIFEPFFTTKEEGEGTGLGLAIVRGIVKAHGGAITVESELGKGTTFTVYLPCTEQSSHQDVANEGPVRGGRERILVLDDDESLARVTETILHRLGYSVIVTKDSLGALALVQRGPEFFDLIITDETMPKITGGKFAVEVQAIRPDLPIVVTTGFSEVMSRDKAKELGLSGFLQKPAGTRDIARVVREALDRTRTAQVG